MVRFERFPQHDDRSSRFDARTLYQDHEKFAVSRDITFSSSAAMTSCTSVAANVGSNVNIENVSQWPKTVGQHPHVQEPLRLYPSVPLSHTPSVLSRQPRYASSPGELLLQHLTVFRPRADPFRLSSTARSSTPVGAGEKNQGPKRKPAIAIRRDNISFSVPKTSAAPNVDPVKKRQQLNQLFQRPGSSVESESPRLDRVQLWIDGIPPPVFIRSDRCVGATPLHRLPTPPYAAGFDTWEDVQS
ncbi:uncharacterized protein EKO05_0001811 [Ascochyta rabiei]|uniref:Uncharacterized protein n=1 Tax=Didymella rabiei TaxID=5454 RepID=A0A163H4C2_DIDRA|nr:uncharacterized protein EKO05_0001811 [Ascochyta rabiei]KZM25150.1 hypothetical protein ST47_g3718 [Ascochyta rabiei]UPX11191.1 hypothetical protein EKO05_0001811 [Ascochyta rabiei]